MQRVILGDVTLGAKVKQWVNPEDLQQALDRHQRGHAGHVGAITHLHNFFRIEHGFVSAHQDRRGHKFVIVTNSLVHPPRSEVFLHAW